MGRGRPVEGLILTEDERNYLKRQLRRHRVARSLSEQCRIVVRCADGLQSKQVAAELGVSEAMLGKWWCPTSPSMVDPDRQPSASACSGISTCS